MGKKQHQKDKLYLTCTEWSSFYGGKKEDPSGSRGEFKRLPFHCCSLTMQPFEHPYCTQDGVIFDIMNIVPFLKKYGVNPVSGEKLSAKDLVKLNFHKNSDDKYHCPVTFKVFNANTHIVAVKTTGNVFSYDAIEQLNIKASFWKDLLTDEPFVRKDIIQIQDPTNLEKFNLTKFYHIRKDLKVKEKDTSSSDPRHNLRAVNLETRDALDELDREYKAPEKQETVVKKADKINAAVYSTGAVAASFTSTVMDRVTHTEHAIIDEDIIRYERIKKKAYVKLITSLGDLNIELHADKIPKASENFLKLCEKGYYNATIFHRSIKNFMIQGGDPTGTGTGGDSYWGGTFPDHFKPNMTHTGRGILSMANSGPNTNKSQFFFTYRSARHLDNKHTVFGRVVGGLEVLDKMEKIETDKKDKPLEDIKILGAQIFVNPYDEVDEQLKQEREKLAEDQQQQTKKPPKRKADAAGDTPKPKVMAKSAPMGIGKYLNTALHKRTLDEEESETLKKKREKTVPVAKLKDFSDW